MSETKTQCFALYGGVFIPIIDDVVRNGAYIVDSKMLSDPLFYALWTPLRRVSFDDSWELPAGGEDYGLLLPVEGCGQLMRVIHSTETSLEIGVKFDT